MKKKRFLLIFATALACLSLTGSQDATGNQARSIDFSFSPIPEEFIIAQTSDLTGQWRGNDGGTYYIRQVGSQVFWFGENSSDRTSWSNVYHGTISRGVITGSWADVPKGRYRNNGTLTLRIASSRRIVRTNVTGAFGGTEWTR
jgi:hypothetical protein